ncbi:hypothetical protein S83_062102 [Arachis hypogaea]
MNNKSSLLALFCFSKTGGIPISLITCISGRRRGEGDEGHIAIFSEIRSGSILKTLHCSRSHPTTQLVDVFLLGGVIADSNDNPH